MLWNWVGAGVQGNKFYTCGFCGNKVGPHLGYTAHYSGGGLKLFIYICPNCEKPTFFDLDKKQTPNVRIGNDVQGITDSGVAALYNQARDCTSLAAYTAATLLCRKILMNLAVQHGDMPGKSFVEYIDYLDTKGYVPPNGKAWVDRIRSKGNEATHEIRLIEESESFQVLKFTEMLLKFSYEFPSMLKEK
ncbi:MAG: DUF4145 domain-containing protein [Thermodesulfobacteriota bacterium]|jgi:hypothetical protein